MKLTTDPYVAVLRLGLDREDALAVLRYAKVRGLPPGAVVRRAIRHMLEAEDQQQCGFGPPNVRVGAGHKTRTPAA